MVSPKMTLTNAQGNLLASTAIPSSGSANFDVDASGKIQAIVQVGVTFGSVTQPAGLQMTAYRKVGNGPQADTVGIPLGTIAAATGTAYQSFTLPTGRWHVVLANLDGTDGVTAVSATDDTIDGIG